MNYKILFFSCLLFLATNSFAQDENTANKPDNVPHKAMAYSLGYSHLRIQDTQVSPFIYSSNNIPINIGFLKRKNNSIFAVDFHLDLGNIKNKTHPDRLFYLNSTNNEGEVEVNEYEMSNFSIIQEGLTISYLRKTNLINNEKFDLYLGGKVNQYFLLSFTVLPIFVISELTINPTAYLNYTLSKTTKMSASMSFPIAGIMSRLPYSNDPADGKHGSFISVYTTGTKFSHPGNYQKIDFSFMYSKQLNKRWEINYIYGFQWLHYSQNRGVKAYNNQFAVQFNRKFKSK
jgi:hypothetical protein